MGPAGGRGRHVPALGLICGLAVGLVLGYLAFHPGSGPRAEEIRGTVLLVAGDGDAVAFRRQDGTDESFQIPASPAGVGLLRRGAEVVLDVVRFEESTVIVRVRPG